MPRPLYLSVELIVINEKTLIRTSSYRADTLEEHQNRYIFPHVTPSIALEENATNSYNSHSAKGVFILVVPLKFGWRIPESADHLRYKA